MSILKWIKVFCRAGDNTTTHRFDYQTLAHLDNHLLRDIGLYIEHGEVRPLTGQPSHGIERVAHEYCCYCGRPMT